MPLESTGNLEQFYHSHEKQLMESCLFRIELFQLGVYTLVSKRIGRIGKIVLFLSLGIILALIVNDFLIARHASSRLYYDVDKIPRIPVAIVLGTSKFAQGTVNLYYRARIKAAVDLFQAPKPESLQYPLTGIPYNFQRTDLRDL